VSLRYQLYRNIFAGVEAQVTERRNANLVRGLRGNEKFFRLYVDVNYY
jgi:hypothetical protein